MWEIIQTALADALVTIESEWLNVFEGLFGDLLDISFFIESFPGLDETILTSSIISKALSALYGVLVLLLTLKLLIKGWKVYVLWRDGEAETPPGEMVVGAIIAIGISVAFPFLLQITVDIVHWILDTVGDAMYGRDALFQINLTRSLIDLLSEMVNGGSTTGVLYLLYAILYIVMLFITLKQGGEMLLFRLAVPIAAVGWVDSDGGVWKPFMQAFFRQIATILVRYFFTFLSVRVMAGCTIGSVIVGIVLLVIAMKTPQILAQFMNTDRSGGMSQKMYTAAMLVRLFKGGV